MLTLRGVFDSAIDKVPIFTMKMQCYKDVRLTGAPPGGGLTKNPEMFAYHFVLKFL